MLVLVPTREDVLAIQSIDQAFDLSTQRIQFWEVALIRVALADGCWFFRVMPRLKPRKSTSPATRSRVSFDRGEPYRKISTITDQGRSGSILRVLYRGGGASASK
jgi:hypothetical protein